MTTLELDTIEMMELYGGSFVQALAEAARRADPTNLARIKTTWPEYWERYEEMARQRHEQRIAQEQVP